jgi:hypothetical protein
MPLFSGEDSFYHVGMAKYILAHGIPQRFPYLYFTILNDKFVDHQFLFHLILIPFIWLFGDNAGAKIANISFVALSFSFLFLIFKSEKFKLAALYTIVLLFVMPSDFYFRMSFIRVQSAALLAMVLACYFIIKNKPLALGILSFLFVWLYGGSVFLPVLVSIYVVAQLLTHEKINWKIFLFGVSGFILGIIINPYFPKNIPFLYSQIFLTGIGAKPYSGGEWRPYDTWYWASISVIPLFIFLAGAVIAFARNIKIDAKKLTLFIFSLFLLTLLWKSKRFIEYWPFFAASCGIIFVGAEFEKWFEKRIQKNYFIIVAPVMMLIVFSLVAIKANVEISRGYDDTRTPINATSTKEVNEYLIKNSSEGDIVFTDDWDVFPFYFYYNQKNNYIVGLDPEFMNQYSHTLYEEYADISSGSDPNNLERIKNDFSAKWILVAADHPQFKYNLKNQPSLFELVYQNDEYTVFRIK